MMRIGLDFGTTNSGAAVFDGQRVHSFALDPLSRDPAVMRSTLYITREGQVFIGQEAIDTYYRQNIGRPIRMARRYVGEIEVTLAGVDSVKGYPVGPETFIRDVYVMVDELIPGRLLRSLKSGLATSHEGTSIFGRRYELEELLALYLTEVRRRTEAEAGQKVAGVVMGRPVNFVGSDDEADNRRAEDRLRRAAEMAGFHDISFELEPVAAALHYELLSRSGLPTQKPQNIVVFDSGGGTLDITVMRIGIPERQVFATGGVGIAGDVFDQRIIEGLLLEHFGHGSTVQLSVQSKAGTQDASPFPSQYTDALVHWQTIPDLCRPETLRFLTWAQIAGSHPARVRALESLLVNNYALHLVDEVERAKIALSGSRFAAIRLSGSDIDLWQPLSRAQFEALIADETHRVEACLLDTLARSGLHADEIDAVVRTGGSAQIPCLIQIVERIFGADKVVMADIFSSVTAGLAIRAHMQ